MYYYKTIKVKIWSKRLLTALNYLILYVCMFKQKYIINLLYMIKLPIKNEQTCLK